MVADAVTIYGKSQCSSCEQSKSVLKSRNIDFEYKQLDRDFTMAELMDLLDHLGMMGFRTFPLIVQKGKGYTFANIKDVEGE
jgi:glutaredoxin